MEAGRFADNHRRPRWWLIALVTLAHGLAILGLARVFAPDAMQSVERNVLSTFTVPATPPPPPPPPPAPPDTPPEPQAIPDSRPDDGAAGAPGRKAVPKRESAPVPKVPLPRPSAAPRATSTGSASTSGARDAGTGTGAAGAGIGTGSGASGSGTGHGNGQGGGGSGGAVTKPVKTAGDINSASDFPVPAGGRAARFGTSVTVAMTVGTNGRATGCRVVRPSPDAEADAIVCRLAEQRFRFRPATNAQGQPVPATYGWRQQWFAR